jgi:hypothetical protein
MTSLWSAGRCTGAEESPSPLPTPVVADVCDGVRQSVTREACAVVHAVTITWAIRPDGASREPRASRQVDPLVASRVHAGPTPRGIDEVAR